MPIKQTYDPESTHDCHVHRSPTPCFWCFTEGFPLCKCGHDELAHICEMEPDGDHSDDYCDGCRTQRTDRYYHPYEPAS